MENFFALFPHNGKKFSTLWKKVAPAFLLLAAAGSIRAALPEPPALPFPLPATDLRVQQTTTIYTPDQFLHVAILNRPLAEYELNDLSALLAQRNWKPQIADSAHNVAAIQNLQYIAPTPELQQPFDAILQLLQSGVKSWTFDTLQLLYAPGNNNSLCLSFPLPSNAIPVQVGAFTADLPLPLNEALFSQAAIQAEAAQITRMETWFSHTPPELFLTQAEPLLLAAGWTPPIPPTAPTVHAENQSARDRLLFMENVMKNAFRVYHRGPAQLTILHTPANSSNPSAPTHSYTFMHRTLLQWPTAQP